MTIQDILNARRPLELFTDLDWKAQFQAYAHLCHPDKNPSDDAKKAYDVLMRYKDIMENGIEFNDEHCTINMKGNSLKIKGPTDVLKTSYDNYKAIKASVSTPAHFERYLPASMHFDDNNTLNVLLWERSVETIDLTLEEKHVKWVLNRCLEFSSLCNLVGGWVHGGLNPNSVLISPQSHGIQIISFYHSRPVGSKLVSAIGMHPYKNWYPSNTFNHKTATTDIDVQMCKRFASYLLGDKSGAGTSLNGKVDDELLSFLLKMDSEADTEVGSSYIQYQDFLNKSPRQFHPLNL